MAKQKGLINFEGTVGGMAFYRGRNGYGMRSSQGSVTAERVKDDEAYVRTRENGLEFGRAGKGGKLLRDALKSLFVNIADKSLTPRLTTELLKVVKSDPVHDRGERIIAAGDLSKLIGFEFNANSALAKALVVPFTAIINRAAATGTFAIPSFIPKNLIDAPKGATHYRYLMGIVSVNFETGTESKTFETTSVIPLLATEAADVNEVLALPGGPTEDPILLVLGIEFLQVINGKAYPLKNSSNNAMAIVDADGVAVAV